MRAPISVIIPTLAAGDSLPGCAAALFEGLEAGLIREVVISDGGSDDQTRAVAERLGAIWLGGPASRGGQLRRGVQAASGDWLLILHADTSLAPGWTGPVIAHMAGTDAGYFQLAFDRGGWRGRAVACWANTRARRFGLPYGDQGLLLSRALYDAVGGYPDQPLMEDVALARALTPRLRPIDATAITSAARYLKGGWARRGARNLLTLARYLAGADPTDLAKRYHRR
ncbi:glycosyltransferase [Pseudooceanicola sp.]|uniref:glycosyltransferase n=1 Tax=Pseudooceanicola sp. TaxID=1914328 RepID=UPI002636CEFB|nr:glycosyltransferase [Pseudooceanicola sp.]MDF1856243.1 glycosyltransferase [Pseudooceanicola sp.]